MHNIPSNSCAAFILENMTDIDKNIPLFKKQDFYEISNC